jgi:NAD(P)-dependent dehydrogenase (short-subunit alcohol dehydrogenase family)
MAQDSKSILISGAAQGIGRCIARRFLEKGHRVFILDVNEEELHYTATVHLKAHASNLNYALCNLRDVAEIRRTVKKAADFFHGHIDVLINNGGIAAPQWKDGKTMEHPETLDEWNAYIETNLTAPFAVSQACIPYMKAPKEKDVKEAGPCIIHVSSFRAYQSDPNQEGYASTKAGQLGLMHSMAITCQQWGIRVNAVLPGRIKVAHECKEGDAKGTEWDVNEDDAETHPTNRAGMPEDIADVVEYLIGAGFVNGQDIVVDGGASKRKNKS